MIYVFFFTTASVLDAEELDEYEIEAALRFRSRMDEEKKEETAVIRCPICSMPIPCSHFLKEDLLKDFLHKRDKDKTDKGKSSDTSHAGSSSSANSAAAEVSAYAKKLLQKERRSREQIVMAETELDNRNTDRSIALVNQYRLRDIAMEKEREAEREHNLKLEEKLKEELEVAAWYKDEERRKEREREERKQELLDLVTEFNTIGPPQQQQDVPADQSDLLIVSGTESIPIPPAVGDAMVEMTSYVIKNPQTKDAVEGAMSDANIPAEVDSNVDVGEVSIKSAIKKISSYDASGKTNDTDDMKGHRMKKKKRTRRVQFSLPTDDNPSTESITETVSVESDKSSEGKGNSDSAEGKEDRNIVNDESSDIHTESDRAASFQEKRKKDYFTNPLPKSKRKMFLFTEDPTERFDFTRPLKIDDTTTSDPVNESNLRLKVSGNIFVHLSEKAVHIPQPVEVTSIKLVKRPRIFA